MRFHRQQQNQHTGTFNKISIQIALLVTLVALGIEPLSAVPLGLPESTAKIGYSAAMVWVNVDDPDGDTESTAGVQPIGLVYTDWFIGDFRHWSELYYYSASLDSSTTNIGQDVERYGLRFSLQKSFRVLEKWAPWLGLGLDVSQAKYTLRHTKTEDGFLAERYPDRDEITASLLINAISEWSIAKDWSLALKLEQSIPLSGDVMEFMASGVVLYRY